MPEQVFIDDFSFVSLWFSGVVFVEAKEVDVPSVDVVVVVGVVVEIVVVFVVDTIVVGPSSSITFSEEAPVPFIGSSRQHRILDMGH